MSTNNARSGGLGLFMLGLVFGATAAAKPRCATLSK